MSETELLAELNRLKSREGSRHEQNLLNKMSRVYRQLLEIDPNQTDYKIGLAETLMRLGTDEKLIYFNYEEAQTIFSEILEIDPTNVEALYRLAHVHLELRQWNEAKRIFEQALEFKLSTIKKVRAYCGLAEVVFRLNQVSEALIYLKRAREQDIDRDCTDDLNRTESMMKNPNKEWMITNSVSSHYAGEEETDVIQEREIRLVVSNELPTLYYQRQEAYLEMKQVEVLRYLYQNRELFLSPEQIHDRVWEKGSESLVTTDIIKDRVKNVISALRRALRELELEESATEILVNKRNVGYKWQGDYELSIKERNPYYEFQSTRR